MRYLLGIVALCATASAAPNQAGLGQALAKIDQAATTFRSMTADVRRVYHTAVINDDTVDSGTVYLKRVRAREYKVLIDLKAPDKRAVALDGRKAEIFYPNINTVQEFDLDKQKRLVDEFLLLGVGTTSKELESGYAIRHIGHETVAGQPGEHLELVPKSKQVQQHLNSFELWVSDATGYPVQQKFLLPGGDYQMVTYTNTKTNPNLPDSALKLQLPRGVKREYPQKP